MVKTARTWMGVSLLAALLIGTGIGVVLDRFVLLPTVRSDVEGAGRRYDSRRGSGDHGQRMMRELREKLDLTADQAEELEGIVARNHEIATEYWRNSRREFGALRERFRADIRAILTESQNNAFDQLIAERERRHGERSRDR